MKVWKANLMLLIVAIIWGGGFVATDLSLEHLSPSVMQFLRFGIGALILLIVKFNSLKKVTKKTVIYGCILGTVFFLGMTLQTFGLTETTVSKNAFFTTTNVIFIPFIMLIFFKRKPSVHLLLGVIMMMVGFFFLLFDIDIFNLQESLASLSTLLNFNSGDFLSLLCAIAFSWHIVLAGKFVSTEDPFMILLFQLAASAVLSGIMAFVLEDVPFETFTMENIKATMLPVLFMAVFSSVISFGMQLYAQQFVPPSNTAIICSLESLFAMIFAVLMGIDPLTAALVIGAIIITLGVIYAETGFKRGGEKLKEPKKLEEQA